MPEAKQSLHSAKSKKKSKIRTTSKSPSRKKTTKSKKSRSRSSSPQKKPIDVMSRPVMENAYYISHNAPQFLVHRGFSWESGGNKGKKKGKKKVKKK